MIDKFKLINFEDVKAITTEKYFSGEKFAVDMFDAKYSHIKEDGEKETPAEVFLRIAYELSRFEKSKDEQKHYCEMWFSLLWTGWFRPGGSIMHGVGNSSKVSLNNCTTIPLGGDSLEEINNCDYNVMKCAAFRQGIGVDVSALRPYGAEVNNAANKSTGVVPWVCKIVDNGKYVGQSGRMPALLMSLKVDHPDVEEFITAKIKQGVIENANISVQITNNFMDAVENGEDWELHFDFSGDSKYETIIKTVKAKEIFSLIAKTAHASAEPGVQYIDLMKKGSMVQCVADATGDKKYEIISTNAPVIGSSLVHTSHGLERIDSLYEADEALVLIDDKHYNEVGLTNIVNERFKEATFKKYVNQPVYNIVLSNGKTLHCNDEHKWLTDKGYKATSDIKKGYKLCVPFDGIWTDILSVEDKNTQVYKDGLLLGWFVGDGFYTSVSDTNKPKNGGGYTNKGRKAIGIIWNEDDPDVFGLFKEKYLELTGHVFNYIRDRGTCFETRSLSKEMYDWFLDFGFDGINKYKVPEKCFKDRVLAAGFLAGLIGSDGYVPDQSVRAGKSIILTTVSDSLAKEVQSLSSAFGVSVSIKASKQRPAKYTLVDGTKKLSKCKPYRFDLSFGNYKSRQRLYNRVGVYHTGKEARLKSYLDKGLKKYPTVNYITVKNVEFTGNYADMYCAQVSDVRGLIIEGVLSSNCSEKPLPAFGVCNLLSINMEMFSINADEYKKELEFIVPYLVRLSDNVVTYELSNKLSPVPEQRDMVESLREIGMGATNIHGWFLKQDLAYDSDKATKIAEDFFKHYAYNVFKTSVALGKEKGNSPAFDMIKDKKEFMNSIYFNNIITEFFDGDVSKIKTMRNMAHMSIAPTGSLSNSFPTPCISSGIEPVIGLYYWRRTRAVENGVYVHYFVIPNILKKYILSKIDKESEDYLTLMKFSGSERDEDGTIGKELVEIINKYIPAGFFKFAHEIDYKKKINLMASVYKWIDAAISCTYNLPNTSTPEDVEAIYIEAYKKGVRAVSVYVDGSREGVLIFNDPITNRSKFERKKNICSKRPESIQINCAPKRHNILECNIHQISIKGETWTVLVGMLYDLPFEIFCGQTEELYIPKSCKKGKIIKRGHSKYSLEIMIRRSPVEYKDLAQVLMSDNERALTRLLSLNLRHGIPLQFIVSQLKKSNGGITTFSTAISRVLSSYIDQADYMYKDTEKKCPGCGKSTMVFKGGCFECVECGYSKCG